MGTIIFFVNNSILQVQWSKTITRLPTINFGIIEGKHKKKKLLQFLNFFPRICLFSSKNTQKKWRHSSATRIKREDWKQVDKQYHMDFWRQNSSFSSCCCLLLAYSPFLRSCVLLFEGWCACRWLVWFQHGGGISVTMPLLVIMCFSRPRSKLGYFAAPHTHTMGQFKNYV